MGFLLQLIRFDKKVVGCQSTRRWISIPVFGIVFYLVKSKFARLVSIAIKCFRTIHIKTRAKLNQNIYSE